MSIKSGQRYKITNETSGLAVDLSYHRFTGLMITNESGQVTGPVDSRANNKSVIGWDFHGLDNQQWITEKQDSGQWTIRSVRNQKYFGFENTPDNGTPIVGIDKPQLWDMEVLSDSEDHDNTRVKLWVRGTLFVVEYPTERSTAAPLQLWVARDGKNQVWVLEELNS